MRLGAHIDDRLDGHRLDGHRLDGGRLVLGLKGVLRACGGVLVSFHQGPA